MFKRFPLFLFLFLFSSVAFPQSDFPSLSANDTLTDDIKSLHHFKKKYAFRQLFIVFAGPYPTSPSSSFGHTFLLMQPDDTLQSYLLWPTINFSANTEGIHPVNQFISGVFDTLEGRISIQAFYEKVRDYGYMESRNLYLFPITLTAREKENFLEELFRVRNKKFGYNFIFRNCSSELNLLLRKTLEETIPYPISSIVMPGDLMARDKGISSIINDPYLIESVESGLRRYERQLNLNTSTTDSTFGNMAGYYLSLIEWKFQRRNEHLTKEEEALIENLRILSSQQVADNSNPLSTNPVPFYLHDPSLLGLGSSVIKGKPSVTFSFRSGLHDWYDHQEIYPTDNFLTFGSIKIEAQESHLKLSELVLFRQISLPVSSSFSEKYSWNTEFGFTNSFAERYVYLKGGFGKTVEWFNDVRISSLLYCEPYLSLSNDLLGNRFGLTILMNLQPTRSVRLKSSIEYDFINLNRYDLPVNTLSGISIDIPILDIISFDYMNEAGNGKFQFSMMKYF